MPSPRMCLSVDEVAEKMGISRPMAFKLANSPGFPAVRIGRRIVVPAEAFTRWLNEQADASAYGNGISGNMINMKKCGRATK